MLSAVYCFIVIDKNVFFLKRNPFSDQSIFMHYVPNNTSAKYLFFCLKDLRQIILL